MRCRSQITSWRGGLSKSLISSGDIGRRPLVLIQVFAEISERIGLVFEGSVTPIGLARRIISAVASGNSGRLFVWDMDKAQDYVVFVDNGYISFISSSEFRMVWNVNSRRMTYPPPNQRSHLPWAEIGDTTAEGSSALGGVNDVLGDRDIY